MQIIVQQQQRIANYLRTTTAMSNCLVALARDWWLSASGSYNVKTKANKGSRYSHFREVSGCGKTPLASKAFMSHSGELSVFHVQKIHPLAISNPSSWASM